MDLKTKKMNEKEQIKEINQYISDALEQWSAIMVKADADEWAYELEYSDRDLLNALQIFNHVASNIAIKSGHLNEENVFHKVVRFTQALKYCFGFDSIELTDKVLGDGSKSTENSIEG